MLEKTEQKFAGATISLAGVVIGSLIVGLAWHRVGSDRQGGLKGGGGVRDTPIVMEGGSIVLSSETAWTCTLDAATHVTTCRTALAGAGQWVRRIRVMELDEIHDIGPFVKVPSAADPWTVTFTTSATPNAETEVMTGTGSAITVTTSPDAKIQLSAGSGGPGSPGNFKELTIFPYDRGNYTNTVANVGLDSPHGPAGHSSTSVQCVSTTPSGIEQNRCFVHFKVVDQ